MEDLPVLVFYIDQAEFPTLTIEEIVDDLRHLPWDLEGDVLDQKFHIGMSFVLQFWSSADKTRPKTENEYSRYWIEIGAGEVMYSLLGRFKLTPSVLYLFQ